MTKIEVQKEYSEVGVMLGNMTTITEDLAYMQNIAAAMTILKIDAGESLLASVVNINRKLMVTTEYLKQRQHDLQVAIAKART